MFKFGFYLFIFIVMTTSFSITIAHTRVFYSEREDSDEDSKESNENNLIINVEMQTFPKTVPRTIVSFGEVKQQHTVDGSDNVRVEVSNYGMEESNLSNGSSGKTSSNTNKSSTNRDNRNSKSLDNNKTKNSEISVSRAQNHDTINNAKTQRTIESERSSYQATSDFLIPSNDKTAEENSPKKNANFDRVLDLEGKNPSRLSNPLRGKTDLHMPSNDKIVEGSFPMKNTNAEHISPDSNSFHGSANFVMPIGDKTSSDVNEKTEDKNILNPHHNKNSFNRDEEKVVLKSQQTSNQKSTGLVNNANLISKGSSISKQANQDNSLAKKSINSNHNIVNHSADKENQSKTLNSIRKTETGQRTKQRLCEKKYMEYMERIFDDNDTISDGSDLEFDGRVLAEPGEYPHMTALGFEEPNQPIDYKCGGSLISENFVLTAAHCTNLTGETPTKVRIGDLNLMVEERYLVPQIRNISRIIMHPQYLSSLYYNDIALLEMDKPVEFTEFVRPIRLWTDKKSLDNITAHAMGYGATAFGKARTNRLTDLNLTIVPNDICNRELPEMPEAPMGVVSQQICARDYLMNRDTCQGDSGGPLQLNVRGRRQRERNHFHLIGITSFGLFCRSSYPSVYTRVSKFLDWIEQIVWS